MTSSRRGCAAATPASRRSSWALGFGPDLSYLVALPEAGELDPQIGWRDKWDRAGEAVEALLGRQVRGKAVLEVAP